MTTKRFVPVALERYALESVVSSVKVELDERHAFIRIFSRGGCAGDLVVQSEDWEAILKLLMPNYTEDKNYE